MTTSTTSTNPLGTGARWSAYERLRVKGFEISYRTLVRYLHEHDYARRIPRSMPEPPDRDAWLRQREDCAQRPQFRLDDPSAVVFFGDEAGFEGDPRPRHKWVKRGNRPTQGYYVSAP